MREIIRKVWAIAWKNLQVLLKDRGELAIMFLMPLLFGTLLSVGGAGPSDSEEENGAAIHLDTYLVNEDEGSYGQMVVDVLEEMPVLRIETLQSAEEADRLVGEGEKLAAIIIPAGFSEQIDAYDPTVVNVVVDPVQQLYAGQVTGLVNYAVTPPTVMGEIQYAIQTLLAESGVLEGADPAVQKAVEAQSVGAIMTQLQALESNPLITLSSAGDEETVEESFNIFAIVFPSFTVMFAFFLIGTVAQSLHAEKDHGTFRRLLAAPIDRGVIIGGTMLAFMIIVFLQVIFLFGVAAGVFGMPLGNSIAGLLLITLALSLAATSLGLLLASVTKEAKQAGAFGLVLGFVLAGLGGTIIQFRVYEAEGLLGLVTRLSPHAHAVEGYQRLLIDGSGVANVIPQALILVGFAIIFFLVSMWLFKFE